MGTCTSDMKHWEKVQHMLLEQTKKWQPIQTRKKKKSLYHASDRLCGKPLSSNSHHSKSSQERKKCHLRHSIKLNKLDKWGLNALHRAAQTGDVDALQGVISTGVDVNKLTSECLGCTSAIVFAASNGHTECVRILLTAGADVNSSDEWGNTALFKASCYNHVDCVRLLLQHGADMSLGNKWGALPLQYASMQGYEEVVSLLIEHSNDLLSSGYHGDTSLPPPLVASATRCHIKCLELLLETGADAAELESSLTMALYYFLCSCAGFKQATNQASITDRFTCLKLLVSHGASIKPEHLKMACYHHFIPLLNLEYYVQMLKMLLQASAYDSRCSQWKDSVMVIFGHVTRLGPHKWDLLRLICSMGFTPSKDLIDSLQFTLTEEEYKQLYTLRNQPRSLCDLSRLVVRNAATSTNVIEMTEKLEIPQLLKDMLQIHSPGYYSM